MRPNIYEFSSTLQEELTHRMDVEEESEDFIGYPNDLLWIHREFMDIDDLGYWDKGWKQFRAEMRRWWIRQGIYREILQAELDRTTVWSGGKQSKGKPDFKMGGKMYVFDKHPPGYFDEETE